ncbi:hypothetical protein PENTCL1PPCAC_27306, partial [Pristionchus entomophagus]
SACLDLAMSNCQSNEMLSSLVPISSEMELFGFALDRMKARSSVSSNSPVSSHERPGYIDFPPSRRVICPCRASYISHVTGVA